MNTLIVITGPTAVGKTALCLGIAKHYGIPIINADSRQIYKDMRIGTASPTDEQLSEVKHNLVGKLELTDYYSASMFENDVLEILKQQFSDSSSQDNSVALLTGGSMMYIDAVCNGIDDIPTIDDEVRENLKMRLESEGLERLCEELRLLDPEYYNIVDKKNTRRVIHGLEICYQTGKTYTSYRKKIKKERPFKIIKIALDRPREELYNRINLRVDQMIDEGLIEEARTLYCHKDLNALNTVGYKEIFEYLDNKCTIEEAIERIKGNTRKYARKQITWFKRDPNVKWLNAEDYQGVMEYISQQL